MSDPYPLDMYGSMLADPVRMGAYRAAMAAAIKPGDTVLDIGTGPGVTALMACKLGAGHVYAVEPNPAIRLGERLARANGFADRITFFEGISTDFALDRPVDVMVSDLRGRFPLHGAHVPAVIDARSRLLKPGGVQIPTRDRLFVGLARDDHQFRRLRRPWVENDFGLDLGVVFEHVINLSLGSNPGTTVAVGDGACWAEVDYTRTTDPNARGRVVLNAPAGAVFNALELWFEAELLPGIGYSTSPRDPVQVYGRTLLPLREQVTLGDDEVVEVSIDMRLMGSGYLTTWRVAVRDAAGETVRVNLAHSTFHASIMSMRDLGTKGSTPLPSPSPKSEAASTVLAGLSDGRGVGELARRVMDRFPGMFGSVSAAEAFVVDLVRLLR